MSIFVTNYSAFSAEDLYHPTLVQIYSIYWDVSLCITTVFLIFMLYTIIKKSSTEMKGYRIYLIHQLIWSYLFGLHLGAWKPVPLWPFYLGYSVGLYSWIPKEYSLLPLIGVTFFSVGMGFSIYISVLHRYAQVSPLSLLYKIYMNLIIRFYHYILIFVVLECGLCIPLWKLRPNPNEMKEIIISRAAYMEFFFDMYPNLFGFAPELNGGNTIVFMGVLISVLCLVSISIFFLYLNFVRILRRNKKLLTQKTYHMQVSVHILLRNSALEYRIIHILTICMCY